MKWLAGLTLLIILGSIIILRPKPSPVVLETKIINLGKVEVAATPERVKANEPIVIKLAFTTHSVELNYDLTQAIVVADDRGNSYPAVNWSDGSGGHHLEGNLTFGSLKSKIKQLRVKFSGIDNQSGQLAWEL